MKTVLISGASSGIGEALAINYANLGWRVFAGGRNKERLDQLCEKNDNIQLFVCDVVDQAQVIDTAKTLPLLDMLILNAGSCEYINNPKAFDAALFKRVIDTNLISVAYCLEHWLPKLKEHGQLAFTSSSASFLPLSRAEAYGASKAALTYLAKTLSIDLAPHNIDVSVINPGFVKTPLTDKNDFDMPGMVDTEQAAKAIIKGLDKRKHTINFPTTFTIVLSLIASLPFSWWRAFSVRFLIRKDLP